MDNATNFIDFDFSAYSDLTLWQYGGQKITFDSEQYVSDEFYEWFVGNAIVAKKEISGTWQFNATLTAPPFADLYDSISFESNGQEYNVFAVSNGNLQDGALLVYGNNSTGISHTVYSSSNLSSITGLTGWADNNYSTISFVSVQEMDEEIYDWFIQNAQEVIPETTYTLEGVWEFNDRLTPYAQLNIDTAPTDMSYYVKLNYDYQGISFNSMAFGCAQEENILYPMYYSFSNLSGLFFTSVEQNTDNYLIYDKDEGWAAGTSKKIQFNTPQKVDKMFYDWFVSNAQLYNPEDEPSQDEDYEVIAVHYLQAIQSVTGGDTRILFADEDYHSLFEIQDSKLRTFVNLTPQTVFMVGNGVDATLLRRIKKTTKREKENPEYAL